MSLAAAVVVLLTLNPLMDGLAPRPTLAMAPEANRSLFRENGRLPEAPVNDLALNAPVDSIAPATLPVPAPPSTDEDLKRLQIGGTALNSVQPPPAPVDTLGGLAPSSPPAGALSAKSKQESARARHYSFQPVDPDVGRYKGKAVADAAGAKADLSDPMARTP